MSDLRISLPRWNLTPKQILPSITAGIVTGLIGVVLDTSLASLIFSGNLSEYIGVGIGVVLVAGIISRVVVAAFSSFPGSVAAEILAIMATTISQILLASDTEANILLTILFMSSFSALLTGGFMLSWGNLSELWSFGVILKLIFGSGFAIALLLINRRYSNFLITPPSFSSV